jgi:hypothetical protein
VLPTTDGGTDCVVFDFATGELVPDRSYFEFVAPGSGKDVDVLTETEFEARLAAYRTDSGVRAVEQVRRWAEQLCTTTGAAVTLRPAGRLLTRKVFDAVLGAGREMPRVHSDSLHKVAYGIAGAPSSCVIFAAFERLDGPAKEIMLRRDRNS